MKKYHILLALIPILVSACVQKTPTVSAITPLQSTPAVRATSTSLPPSPNPSHIPPSVTPVPTTAASPTSSETLFPKVTFSQNVICRLGPDDHYYKVVSFSAGQTSDVQARSEDGKWLNVLSNAANKSYTCWIPITGVQPFGEVEHLLVTIPPPLPDGPTHANTSKSVCGINRNGAIVVTWGQTFSGTGYYLLRNGTNIATVYGDTYIDHDTPGSKSPYVYTYVVQAFNSVGLARVVASASVTLCD
ncbi:MAG TPA: hypothetical protein VGK00_05360 [Anaerolineales bacterium]|jgi:hypothetical protein